MGSYAEAKAAVRQYLETRWTATRLVFPNETPEDPWPPVGGDGWTLAWAFCEMMTLPGQRLRGVGLPGDQISQTDGFIYIHIFAVAGRGDEMAVQLSEEAGELFRARKLYEADGCYLRTWVPRVDEGGDAGAESEIAGVNTGNWYRVTMSVPFQYFHQG